MLVRRCWFDLKSRFSWTVGFSLGFVVYFFSYYIYLMKMNDSGILSPSISRLHSSGWLPEAMAKVITRIIGDYAFYVDVMWFGRFLCFFLLFAIVLALGGTLIQKNRSALHMTLSLPIKRSHWLMVHAGITALLVFILIFASTICVLAGSYIMGKYYSLNAALVKALIVWLFCLPWIGLSLLANSFFHNGFKSVMVLIIVFIIVLKLQIPGLLISYWYMFVDLQQAFAWKDLLVILMTTIGTTGLAVWKFGKNEY